MLYPYEYTQTTLYNMNFSRQNCKALNVMMWYPSIILSEDNEKMIGTKWTPIHGWDVYDERCRLMKEQSGKDKIRLTLARGTKVNLDYERNKVTILKEQAHARTTGVKAKSNNSKRKCNRKS